VIGVEEEWGLESHLFGWRPERVARECPASMLIVRKATSIAGGRGQRETDTGIIGSGPTVETAPRSDGPMVAAHPPNN
jgi:hypothetical protein